MGAPDIGMVTVYGITGGDDLEKNNSKFQDMIDI